MGKQAGGTRRNSAGGDSNYTKGSNWTDFNTLAEVDIKQKNMDEAVKTFANSKRAIYTAFDKSANFIFDEKKDNVHRYTISTDQSREGILYRVDLTMMKTPNYESANLSEYNKLRSDFNKKFYSLEEAYSHAEEMRKKMNKLKID